MSSSFLVVIVIVIVIVIVNVIVIVIGLEVEQELCRPVVGWSFGSEVGESVGRDLERLASV